MNKSNLFKIFATNTDQNMLPFTRKKNNIHVNRSMLLKKNYA